MLILQVYVQAGCRTCVRSRALAQAIAAEYPTIQVLIIPIESLSAAAWPEALFATPTWLLDGHRIGLGTPDPVRLRQQLDAAISSSTASMKGHS